MRNDKGHLCDPLATTDARFPESNLKQIRVCIQNNALSKAILGTPRLQASRHVMRTLAHITHLPVDLR